jgi:DNA-binding response OmpR family regulator
MRVLVVSDRQAELQAIVRIVRRAGHRVEQASDAKSAVARTAREPADVMVVGWPLPSDAELATLLSGGGSDPAYVIVVLDSANAGRSIKALLAAGADDFLLRPVLREELLARVETSRKRPRWATAEALDWSASPDLSHLRAWRSMGAILGKIIRREGVRLPAARLREGMVMVSDLRKPDGALLVAAGTRLTLTTAEHVARAVGDGFVVEVARSA